MLSIPYLGEFHTPSWPVSIGTIGGAVAGGLLAKAAVGVSVASLGITSPVVVPVAVIAISLSVGFVAYTLATSAEESGAKIISTCAAGIIGGILVGETINVITVVGMGAVAAKIAGIEAGLFVSGATLVEIGITKTVTLVSSSISLVSSSISYGIFTYAKDMLFSLFQFLGLSMPVLIQDAETRCNVVGEQFGTKGWCPLVTCISKENCSWLNFTKTVIGVAGDIASHSWGFLGKILIRAWGHEEFFGQNEAIQDTVKTALKEGWKYLNLKAISLLLGKNLIESWTKGEKSPPIRPLKGLVNYFSSYLSERSLDLFSLLAKFSSDFYAWLFPDTETSSTPPKEVNENLSNLTLSDKSCAFFGKCTIKENGTWGNCTPSWSDPDTNTPVPEKPQEKPDATTSPTPPKEGLKIEEKCTLADKDCMLWEKCTLSIVNGTWGNCTPSWSDPDTNTPVPEKPQVDNWQDWCGILWNCTPSHYSNMPGDVHPSEVLTLY